MEQNHKQKWSQGDQLLECLPSSPEKDVHPIFAQVRPNARALTSQKTVVQHPSSTSWYRLPVNLPRGVVGNCPVNLLGTEI